MLGVRGEMGSAPYLGGGFGHFYAYAPFKIEYAIDRFAMEVKRQLDVLDRRLAETEYLGGDEYTIADMAGWPGLGWRETGSKGSGSAGPPETPSRREAPALSRRLCARLSCAFGDRTPTASAVLVAPPAAGFRALPRPYFAFAASASARDLSMSAAE